jgi:hypothetical protein
MEGGNTTRILAAEESLSPMISETPGSARSALQEFLAALETAISCAGPSEPAAQVVRRVFQAAKAVDEPPAATSEAPPVCALLDQALATARDRRPPPRIFATATPTPTSLARVARNGARMS